MSHGKHITREHVEKVRRFDAECPGKRAAFVAEICGISPATVSRIRKGNYDHLMGGSAVPEQTAQKPCGPTLFEQAILESLARISAQLDEMSKVQCGEVAQ